MARRFAVQGDLVRAAELEVMAEKLEAELRRIELDLLLEHHGGRGRT
jgi:hypothetical protein